MFGRTGAVKAFSTELHGFIRRQPHHKSRKMEKDVSSHRKTTRLAKFYTERVGS